MSEWTEWGATTTGVVGGIILIVQTMGMLSTSKTTHGELRKDVQSITAVCYLFSLSAYLTAMAGAWLLWTGQVSNDGHPVSEPARLAFLLAGESVAFQHELAVVVALLSIVIVPQLMNYLVAGLFGAAGHTRLGAWCLKVIFWTTVKGFAVAGGVSVAWSAIALWLNWPNAYESKPYDLLGTGLGQMATSVMAAALTGPLVDDAQAFMRSKSKPIVAPFLPLHRWLTRNRTPKERTSDAPPTDSTP